MAAIGLLVAVSAVFAPLGIGALTGGRQSATGGSRAGAPAGGGAATSAAMATTPTTMAPGVSTPAGGTPVSSTPASPPTNMPAPTATPALTIAFTCTSATVGGSGQLCVHTRANAMLNMSVVYCDGATASNRSDRANASGDSIWQWTVSTKCASGTAVTANVTAKSTGQQVTDSTTFTITG